jgi:DNA mismatch repair protein MutS2
MLQEAIITQRGGRYVIPLQAGFKGKVPAIIHDQSGSGQTLFVEPLAVVELNNTWQQLKLEERDEVRRILAELSAEIGEVHVQIRGIVESVAEIDFALMCAKYAEDLRAAEPEVLPWKPGKDNSHPGSVLRLIKARHPLLAKSTAVPVDILLEPPNYAMVITGPNTGGKTVTLKTAGLLVAMAQSGLHIPVQSGSSFTVFEDIYADIGDEQSIEQSLSTFSGHIKNMVHILDEAHQQTLVLLDELGSGTDPGEGAALAHAILISLTNRRIPCMVATHYPELKNFAYHTPGVVNAAMSFDLETLSPTYHLLIGLPGRSNALLIAERVGLSPRIIELARENISSEDRKADDMLEDIQYQKDQMREARTAAEEQLRKAEQLRAELQKRLDNTEQERIKILEQARKESQERVEKLQKEVRNLKRRMKRAVRYAEKAAEAALEASPEQKRAQREVLRQESLAEKVESTLDRIDEELSAPISRQEEVVPQVQTSQAPRPMQAGDLVMIRSLQKEGTLVSLDGSTAEVQLGPMRMKTSTRDLERAKKKPEIPPHMSAAVRMALAQEPAPSPEPVISVRVPSPGMELDLRGQRADDALDQLRGYLEQAYLSHLPFGRIIHGKGSGRLRDVVREALEQSTYVSQWEEADEKEGGSGVTIVKIKG